MSQHWISWLVVTLPFIPIRLEVADWYAKTLLSIDICTYFFAICTRVHTLILQLLIDSYLRQHFRKTISGTKT